MPHWSHIVSAMAAEDPVSQDINSRGLDVMEYSGLSNTEVNLSPFSISCSE